MFTFNFSGTKAEVIDKCVGENVNTNEAFHVNQNEPDTIKKVDNKLDKPVVSCFLYFISF